MAAIRLFIAEKPSLARAIADVLPGPRQCQDGYLQTQAQIIETLFDRRFIEKKGRQVWSTPIGRSLIQALPETATSPEMTALWEAAMRRIAGNQMALETFLAAITKQIGELVASGRAHGALRIAAGVSVAMRVGGKQAPRRRTRRRKPRRATDTQK